MLSLDNVINRLMWSQLKISFTNTYYIKITNYCYHLVNVITFGPVKSDHIKQLLHEINKNLVNKRKMLRLGHLFHIGCCKDHKAFFFPVRAKVEERAIQNKQSVPWMSGEQKKQWFSTFLNLRHMILKNLYGWQSVIYP